MTAEGIFDELLSEVTPALRDVLRRAYELGYREAITHEPGGLSHFDVASANRDTAPESPTTHDPSQAPIERLLSDDLPSTPLPEIPPPLFAWDQDSVEDDGDDDDDPRAHDTAHRRRRVGIRTTSTIGLLKRKIEKEYRLDRFAIEVIITRAGDRDRRQLPSHVKLAAYIREE